MCNGLEKIYERNKDTGAIRSRKPMDYGQQTKLIIKDIGI